jgi:hypothetical protein
MTHTAVFRTDSIILSLDQKVFEYLRIKLELK